MGEKNMEDCIETRFLGIISLYKEMMELSANNHVIDRTKEFLISGNPDFEDFIKEVSLISKAELNVTFGNGGPLSMCQAFSRNNLCYVGRFEIKWQKNNYLNLVETIEDLILRLSYT